MLLYKLKSADPAMFFFFYVGLKSQLAVFQERLASKFALIQFPTTNLVQFFCN